MQGNGALERCDPFQWDGPITVDQSAATPRFCSHSIILFTGISRTRMHAFIIHLLIGISCILIVSSQRASGLAGAA